MNLNNFPKRLDSKTSCLRITVPENLDLALEGLIRKVLREQPKTDYIHSFAADYFETLLRIRDKAGAKYSASQLCPFHNDEDAHEMIKLASNFNKPLRKKSKESIKGDVSERGKGTDDRSQSRGTPRAKAKGRSKSKQATPDLIKKLPGKRPEEEEKKADEETTGTQKNDEEASLTSDPIKELVEKELKMEALAQKTETDSGETCQQESAGERPEGKDAKEEANVREGDEEDVEMRKENLEDSKAMYGSDEMSKEGKDETATEEESNEEKEQTRSTDEQTEVRKPTDEERISGSEPPDAEELNNKEKTDEESSDATTSGTKEAEVALEHQIPAEISTPETENDMKKEDLNKLSSESEKKEENTSAVAETTSALAVENDLPTAEKDDMTEHPDSGAETDLKVKIEEKESESNRQVITEVDTESPEKSMPEDKGSEPAEVQEQSVSMSVIDEGAADEAEKADAAVEEAIRTTSPLLGNTDEQQEQPEPEADSKSKRKELDSEKNPPTGEQTTDSTPPMAEDAKQEKPETEEEFTPNGIPTGDANILVAKAEVEAEVPVAEEQESSPVTPEEDSKAFDRPVNKEENEGEKEKPSEDQIDEPVVEEAAGEELQPASTSTDGMSEVETPEQPINVKEVPERDEQNEQPEDELCTVVDVHQIPAQENDDSQKKEQEQELCTAVDSQHVIRVEEPPAANDDSKAPQPPQEVQIKTIQTHYYDSLKVPETVTKELKVHNVSHTLPLPEEPTQDGANTDSPSSSEEKNPPTDPVEALNQPELGSDTRRTEMDDLLDLMTPTSGYSLNLSDLSWQTVSGLFLDSERQHSSRLSDELRYATSKAGEKASKPEESRESTDRRPEIEEVFHRTVLPTLVGAVPIPPRDAEEIDREDGAVIEEKTEEKKEKKPEADSFGGSSNGRSFDSDTPFISVEVKTVIETQVLDDEDDEGEGRPQLELKVETTVDVEEAEGSPAGEEAEMSDRQQKGDDGEVSGERPAGKEGSSGESDSTISSAATEIKRSDSVKRALGGDSILLTSQSLDLGGRNPLLRTRSLSTFRYGVTDFEVWSAIEKELEEAATKIQSRFRRYKARKKLHREDAVQITTEESSTSTTPAEPDERQQSTGEFHDSIVLSDHPR